MLGSQVVGVVTRVPLLDANDRPVLSELMIPQTTERVVAVPGCLFEEQDMSAEAAEQGVSTTTVRRVAWCLMPVSSVTVTIPSTAALRWRCEDWEMRGPARVEVDLNGQPDHVFCLVSREVG